MPAGDIPLGADGNVRVDIRGKEVPVRVVKFPFVRDGKAAGRHLIDRVEPLSPVLR